MSSACYGRSCPRTCWTWSGRGAFLWPLLDEFPHLLVTAIDEDPIRARDIQAVRLGGIAVLASLTARCYNTSATLLPAKEA